MTAIIQQQIDGKIAFELFYKPKKSCLTLYVEDRDAVFGHGNVTKTFLRLRAGMSP
ncbi:hypothetical protein [Borrelia turicatae]|uniref:hypothetical protein n=1 Tax=Borrelia turicatae TaxID=142 RepID=UPI001FF37531|nr:hypothetical protein [Borrelia turicatae]UPA14290.1 hypothetical protein bt91E135_001471 [Borrelia turicatae 91E135]